MKATDKLATETDRAVNPRWQIKVLAVVILLLLTLAGGELAAMLFYGLVVSPQLEQRKVEQSHYYRLSSDPLLGYELLPGFHLEHEGRDLAINSFGLRGAEPISPKAGLRFAVLGDSVTFGIGQGEAQTIPRMMQNKLQQECGTSVEVLNLGVPGYATQELNEQLKIKASVLSPDGVIYLLNLNDFARRNTLWEGADAGLYRMYWSPRLKLPFLLQKALYRWEKGGKDDGSAPSLDWYRWLFNGTSSEAFQDISDMNLWAKSRGIAFAVSIFPSGAALAGGANALADEHRAIVDALHARGIVVADDVRPFLASGDLFDETDHLTAKGNDVASTQLTGVLMSSFREVTAKAGCKSSS